MSDRYRKCIHCDKQFDKYAKRYGMVNECNTCGREGSDKDTVELGGVMIYDCKTNGTIQISTMENTKHFKNKTDRRGGQGTVKGLSERR